MAGILMPKTGETLIQALERTRETMSVIKGKNSIRQGLSLMAALGIAMIAGPAQAITHTYTPVYGENNRSVVRHTAYYILDEASALVGQKQYPEAIVLLNEVIDKDPVNIFAHFNLGFCYLEMAKIADSSSSSSPKTLNQERRVKDLLLKAEHHFQRVQNLNPELSVSYFKLGKIALMMNEPDRAESYYKEALELEPESAPLAFNLGRVYDQENNVPKAVEMYQQAIQFDPHFVFAYNNLGLLYEGQKNFSAAERVYQAALKEDPSYNYARLNLGNLYAELGRLPEAKRQYEEAIRLEPNNSWAHLYLGNVQFLLGNYQSATRSYQTSITLNPEFSTAYYLLAVSLSKQERMDEAMNAGLQYMSLDPDGRYSEQLRNLIGAIKVQRTLAAPDSLRNPQP